MARAGCAAIAVQAVIHCSSSGSDICAVAAGAPALDTANGLEERSVVACDHIMTIPVDVLGLQIGRLLDRQEPGVSAAIRAAFDLD